MGLGNIPSFKVKKQSGFTLIELLIVVAIIAILVAIAIPNFLQAQIRAKVSRVKADMASLATALEAYAVDNNQYPWALYANARKYFNDTLLNLTTPIAYISSLPVDPFEIFDNNPSFPQDKGTLTYEYADRYIMAASGRFDPPAGNAPNNMPNYDLFFTPNTQWSLLSAGPQGNTVFQFGIPPTGIIVPAGESNAVVTYTYDPTNGTVSNGSLWRYGP
jgi:type II secretion system protein G